MPTHLLHPFTPPAKDEFITIVRGEGSKLWDADGKEYVDGLGSLWYCQVGHGRREIVDAVTAQMSRLEAYHIFDPFTNEPAEAVASRIAEVSPHPDGRVFLACSGSESVDTAVKMARLYHRLNGEPDRQMVVRRTGGYHGTNVGGTSVQGIEANREGWGDLLSHVAEIPNDDIEPAAQLFAAEGDRIAAVISEPVQGAGGVYPPPDGYLEGLRRLCDQHGALLIVDEVICGFGRLGRWFGSQHFGVAPDLITFAKGVTSGYQPLAGVIVGRRVADVFEADADMLRTGYTYSGHPAACAAGIANMAVIDDEGLLDRSSKVGAQIRDGLAALTADGVIEGYRGEGAVWAAELGRDVMPLRPKLLEMGIIVRPLGTAFGICPPLVITDGEIGRILDAIATVAA